MQTENIWILVCTYQRNDLLGTLLKSLKEVQLPTGCTLEQPHLIVVDNASEPAAEHTVRSQYPQALYIHQSNPGIATARNTALEQVPETAEAVIFLDDDEHVDSGWFTALLETATDSGADAVAGPVIPVFEDSPPQWTTDYGYVRRTDFPTGPHHRRLATNNTLVRAEWFRPRHLGGREFRFHETFNFIGGSDSDLFERMLDAGAQFWWCAEAVVNEHVPPERATKAWLRRRAVRGGQVRAAKHQLRASGAVRGSSRVAAEGLARAGYGALRRFASRARRRPITYTDDYYLCEGWGMLASLMGPGRAEYGRNP